MHVQFICPKYEAILSNEFFFTKKANPISSVFTSLNHMKTFHKNCKAQSSFVYCHKSLCSCKNKEVTIKLSIIIPHSAEGW